MYNKQEIDDLQNRLKNMPVEEAFKTESFAEQQVKHKTAMQEMYDWLTAGGGYKYCDQIVIDKAEELVEKEATNNNF